MRLTLHSSDPRFKEIAGRIEQLSIKELNEDEFLRENSIQVVSTQSACLIVDVRIKGPNVDIPLSMERLVECLMRRCNAFQVLSDNNVDELKIHGYYYQPGDYVHTTGMWLSMASCTWTAILEKNPNSIKITVLFYQTALFVNFLNLFLSTYISWPKCRSCTDNNFNCF